MAKRKLIIADMKKDMPKGARDESVKRDRTGAVILNTVNWDKKKFLFEDPAETFEEAVLEGAKAAQVKKKNA